MTTTNHNLNYSEILDHAQEITLKLRAYHGLINENEVQADMLKERDEKIKKLELRIKQIQG